MSSQTVQTLQRIHRQLDGYHDDAENPISLSLPRPIAAFRRQPAASGAGGDVYLVSMCACASISRFVLADVAGHSERAASLALRLRRLMRRHINTPDQTQLARSLNDDFSNLARDGMFATALLATYFPPSQQLILCNAGHPRPLWYHAQTRTWEFVHPGARPPDGPAINLPLGVIRDTDYLQTAVRLRRGDLLLAFTDGLTESSDEKGRRLDDVGLLELLGQCDPTRPEVLLASLRDGLRRHTGLRPRDDDVSLLLLRANGGQPPKRGLLARLRMTMRMLGLKL